MKKRKLAFRFNYKSKRDYINQTSICLFYIPYIYRSKLTIPLNTVNEFLFSSDIIFLENYLMFINSAFNFNEITFFKINKIERDLDNILKLDIQVSVLNSKILENLGISD